MGKQLLQKRDFKSKYKKFELEQNRCANCGGMIEDYAREYGESIMCDCWGYVETEIIDDSG